MIPRFDKIESLCVQSGREEKNTSADHFSVVTTVVIEKLYANDYGVSNARSLPGNRTHRIEESENTDETVLFFPYKISILAAMHPLEK